MAFFTALGTALGASAAAAAATGIAATGLAVSVVGAGVSAYGQRQQGKALQAEANYNAQVMENNAVAAGYAAIQEQQAAEREAEALREERIRMIGQHTAAASKSGLTISGSVVDVMSDNAAQYEKEIQFARYRGEVEAYNYMGQARDSRSQARMLRTSGKNARRSANIGAFSTILGGVGRAASGYADLKTS